MPKQMDPDRYQMRELKRRITKLEDHLGYLKTDLKRVTMKHNKLQLSLEAYLTHWSVNGGAEDRMP